MESLVPKLESWLCCPHNPNANPSLGGSAVVVSKPAVVPSVGANLLAWH